MTLTIGRVLLLSACLIFAAAAIGLGGPVDLVATGLGFMALGLVVR